MPFVDLRPQAARRNPQEMLKHLQSFSLDLKFSAGIWYFSPPGGRFHDRYGAAVDIEGRLAKAAALVNFGLKALEAHYPNEINEDNLPLWTKFSQQTGIRVLTIVPLLFWDTDFEWGSLSSPLEGPRRKAIERTKATLKLNRELDTDFAIVWPGIDGYENPFAVDFIGMRDRFAAGLAEAMDAVPGVRIAFEPKPYEPRGHILYGTTVEGVLLGHKVERMLQHRENQRILGEGHALVCLNPEIGHVLMGYEDLAYAYSWPMEQGRLAHTHINSQPLGNYDQDLNAGVVGPEQLEALLYTLKMYGYTGYFGIDINPERMPVETALKNNFDALRAANDRINELDHEALLFAQNHPDRTRGWLEAYLIRRRAPHPEKLAPLPRPQ
ncbi:MAG: TIM barrel protein [Planctomycetota bacterium]